MKSVVLIAMVAILCFQASFRNADPENIAQLGRMLFFDPILSKDRTVSCATCHKPDFAFADTSAVSIGVKNRKGLRNTPTAMNLLLQKTFFWDGRAKDLEAQALAPIADPNEMDLPVEVAVSRLRNDPRYQRYFRKIFNAEPSDSTLAIAIADFERSLETSDSPFDNWKFSDDSNAVSASVKRGFEIFNTKGNCSQCHFGSNLTANEFRNIGLFDGASFNDSGRAVVTGLTSDIGKFKTASLRNIAITAPYMHNGMFKTLREVIDFYDDPRKIVPRLQNIDTLLAKPLNLTTQEKEDLEAFLHALTDKTFSASKR